MHIAKVNYQKTFNLGNYQSEKIGIEMELNQGESASKALDVCKELVEEYHRENLKTHAIVDVDTEPIEDIRKRRLPIAPHSERNASIGDGYWFFWINPETESRSPVS